MENIEQIKLPDGRIVEYKDVIHHTTYHHFGFMDRIRILFRGQVHVMSEIYCKELPNVQGSTAKTHVRLLFRATKRHRSMADMPYDETNTSNI